MIDPIAVAIPVFFVAIGGELVAAARRGRRVYRFGDAIVDMACGIEQQVLGLLTRAVQIAIYVFVWHTVGRERIAPSSPWAWILAAVGVDFLYYWWHRASHEVNALWAAHVVHHQSEDYNLAVALRQAITTDWTALPFYLPLAVIGVPVVPFAVMHALSTLYQFWIHTELVGRLPIADKIVNTPSLHRVHHAINPRYLDKNYGATLMIWDRLFGTYEPEVEPPVFGLVKPLASWNPLVAQLHYWAELVRRSWTTRGLDRLRVWWRGPAWSARNEPHKIAPEVSPDTFQKYDPPSSRGVKAYILAQFALASATVFAMLVWHARLSPIVVFGAAALVLAATVVWGGLLERRKWAWPVEALRWAGAIALAWWSLR